MPQIPKLKENQRTNPRNPTGFQRSNQARVAGETLAGFGRGVASLGEAFVKADSRAKDAQRRLAGQDYKNALTRRLQDAKAEIQQSDATGGKFVESFDEMSSEIKADLADEFSEKYNGLYGEDFRVAGDAIIVGNRQGMVADAFKKQEDFIKKAVVQTTNEMNSAAFTNPSMIDSLSADYTTTIAGSMQDLGASESKIKEAHDRGQTQLVDSAMRGYIEQEKWNEAKLLVLRDYKGLFDTEGQTKRMAEIRDAELDAGRLKEKEISKLERDLEKKTKEDKQSKASQLMGAYAIAAQNGDNKQIYKVKQQIIESGKKGDIAYAQFGGLLDKTDKGFKEANAVTDYEITRKVYRAKSAMELRKLRTLVQNKQAAGRLNPADGDKHERTIHNLLKQGSSNPSANHMWKAAIARGEAFTKTEAFFDTIGNFDAKSDMIRRKALFDSDMLVDRANGVPPMVALRKNVMKHYTGTDTLEPFPSYNGKLLKDEQALEEFTGWKNGKYKNDPSGMQQADLYIQKVRDAMGVDSLILETQKLREASEAEARTGEIKNTLDVDTLVKPRGAMQTLMEVVNQLFGDEPDANRK